MRRQINGLAVAVEQEMNGDPFSHAVFLFCNRERRIIKALYWDATGFAMWQKRLEKHRFPWPRNREEAAREIDAESLALILSGIDVFGAHESVKYSRVS